MFINMFLFVLYSFLSEVSSRQARPDDPPSSLNSLSHSDSMSFKRPGFRYDLTLSCVMKLMCALKVEEKLKVIICFFLSETNTSSRNSSSYSPAHRDQTNKEADKVKRRKGRAEGRNKREGGSSSIEEEVPTAANDSLCSESIPFVRDEKGALKDMIYFLICSILIFVPILMGIKNTRAIRRFIVTISWNSYPGDSTSVATEYSLKFDESMTEDDIEERSFRSLLPSEAHRRGTLEKKSQPREGSEDDHVSHSTLFSEANNILKVRKRLCISFSHFRPLCLNFFNICFHAASRCKHVLLRWTGQLFSVHDGHGTTVHEGWGGQAAAPELSVASSTEGRQGEDENGAGLAGASEKETEGQGRGWQNATNSEETEGSFIKAATGAGIWP